MIAGTLTAASVRVSREYQEASQPAGGQPVKSDSLAGEKLNEANAAQDRAKPYEVAEYRRFPVVGSRVAIWAVAQLHLLFAAFVPAVPIFAPLIAASGHQQGATRA